MKNKKTIIISISAIALILITAISYTVFGNHGNKSKDPSKIIVSKYKGGKVTLKEAQNELSKLILRNNKLRGLTFNDLNTDQKELVIKEVILKEIAYKEAKKRKLHKKEEYQESLKTFETEILKQNLYDDIARKTSKEENVKSHYDKLVSELKNKKEIRIRFISVKTKQEADSLYKTISKYPNSFAKQAKRKSLDKTSTKNGGDLGFVLKDKLNTEIIEATKTLKKGQMSKPISLADN
ncbi:peptidylprolyl isomerase [Rickettsiales bacterium]|nr:peptidylprolyl isomerase [Rickettsiales bacterium]